MRLLKGKLGKRSGHLLILYSSFVLLWSMERTNRLGKILCDQKIWEVCLGQKWAEPGGAWFKVSYNIVLLKWQNKGGLLLRALSCWKLLTEALVTPSLEQLGMVVSSLCFSSHLWWVARGDSPFLGRTAVRLMAECVCCNSHIFLLCWGTLCSPRGRHIHQIQVGYHPSYISEIFVS